MARMYPDNQKTRVVFASAAEEGFYDQCRAQLNDDWLVFYSCTLSQIEDEQGLRDNEMDFILYHPKFGVILVEVKGGRIKHDVKSGRFFSINRHGESFSIKDPFQQVLSFKSRLLRFLRQNNLRVPLTQSVCLPSVYEEEFPVTAGMSRDLIIGREKIKDLPDTLASLVKMSQPAQFLDFKNVGEQLVGLLVGTNFTTRLFLKDYIESHENRVKDIESIHETLLTPIASSKRLGIEGEAGTGKTMLALLLARHFRDQGKKVLLLSSNSLLGLFLREQIGEGVDVVSYPELASSYGVNLLIPPSEFEGKKDDWVQYEAPEKLKTAIQAGDKKYDVVIADEAQDVQPFWWEPIELLLDPHSEDSRFYVCFDRSQGVFGSTYGQFVPEEVLPVPAPYFPLVHNYRTTREIAGYSRHFRTGQGVLQSHCGRLGYVPEIVIYKDAEHAKKLLQRLTKKLVIDEGLDSRDMTILSARNPSARESVFYQTDSIGQFPLHKMVAAKKDSWSDVSGAEGSIPISTIAGFKGLETKVGILTNLSEYNMPADNPIMSSLIYVACTRAKHMLYIFLKEGDPKIEAFDAAMASIENSGSIVVGTSQSDFTFTGVVTHYNPERVGWLKVDDPAFEQPAVMFFPNDVKIAGIGDLKVGAKVKFRPRAEGPTTVATDLTKGA